VNVPLERMFDHVKRLGSIMSNDWYIKINNAEHGPLSSDKLKQLAQQGKVTPETFVKKGASSTWSQASHVTGLFPIAASAGTPTTAVPLPKLGSPPTISTAWARSAEAKDNLVRNVAIGAGAITVVIIALLVVPGLFRDKWELNNIDRVVARLKEADALQKSDPFASYKIYDAVLKEAKQHKTTDLLSNKLASAEKARTGLYPKVEDKIRAEEAEKKRVAEEKSRRANEEKQRIAEQKLAEQRAGNRKSELKEQAAKYKNASPQARTALNALKRIQARTEVGITRSNYSQVLGEQYGEIKIFTESPEGQSMPLFSSEVSEAIKHYKKASNDWESNLTYSLQIEWGEASKAIKKAEDVLLNPEKYLEASP